MPRRALSDEPQTDNESEQEEQEQPAGGLKNPGRTLQHMMLQVFFSRPVMTNAAVKRVYAKCVKLSTIANAPALATFMSDLEGPLATCGLSLKNRLDVDTNTLTWILLNDYSDEPSKLATEYSPQEIAFFRIIVKKIMTASRMAYAIKLKEAIQYSKSAGLPTILHGQAVITSFIAKGWLCRSDQSRLTLSHRARTELWKYLKETFVDEDEDEDIEPHDRSYVTCKVCVELVTKGWACPNEKCVVRLHGKCVAPFLNAQNGVCPGTDVADCGQQWPGNTVKGFTGVTVGLGDSDELFRLAEDADTDDEAAAAGSGDDDPTPAAQKKKGARKSNASAASGKGKGKGRASSKGKRAAGSDDDEEMDEQDVDEEEEEEAEDSADDAVQGLAAAISQKQRNPRGKKAVKYEGDDEGMSE